MSCDKQHLHRKTKSPWTSTWTWSLLPGPALQLIPYPLGSSLHSLLTVPLCLSCCQESELPNNSSTLCCFSTYTCSLWNKAESPDGAMWGRLCMPSPCFPAMHHGWLSSLLDSPHSIFIASCPRAPTSHALSTWNALLPAPVFWAHSGITSSVKPSVFPLAVLIYFIIFPVAPCADLRKTHHKVQG